MADIDNAEWNAGQLNYGLTGLLKMEHDEHAAVYRALASQDQMEKARVLVDVSSQSKPGDADTETLEMIGGKVALAGQLLAEQKNRMVETLA